VFPSLAEAFGIAVVEAMARGLPSIASSWGALPEVVGDIGPEWIVHPHDVAGWSRAMEAMISLEEDARAALSVRAREIADRYSPARHFSSLEDIYQRLIADSKLQPRP
jgi:glycosyltransferase involved in cell wall biosynthesis